MMLIKGSSVSNHEFTDLFESPDTKVLREVNEDASVPFDEIEEVLDLIP